MVVSVRTAIASFRCNYQQTEQTASLISAITQMPMRTVPSCANNTSRRVIRGKLNSIDSQEICAGRRHRLYTGRISTRALQRSRLFLELAAAQTQAVALTWTMMRMALPAPSSRTSPYMPDTT